MADTKTIDAGAPEIEITPEMIEAGERALNIRFFDLCAGIQYPQIAKTVFEAMLEARPERANKAR